MEKQYGGEKQSNSTIHVKVPLGLPQIPQISLGANPDLCRVTA